MAIPKRRASSSQLASEKKIAGHRYEKNFAAIIQGEIITGTGKGDVKDKDNKIFSIKSGKKWQIFLYGYERIKSSKNLKIFKQCLDAFPEDSKKYFEDRETCLSYKKNYSDKKKLTNQILKNNIGHNTYTESKEKLAIATKRVSAKLKNKANLKTFLTEAMFNNIEVDYFVVIDSESKSDITYKIFQKNDVIEILTKYLDATVSAAGKTDTDYNVDGQKTLLRYQNSKGKQKNIVEIEIRNDSDKHYRQVRINMYSKDALYLLLKYTTEDKKKTTPSNIVYYIKC